MAEEDLIFGKKMHLFGGTEPSNMKTFQGQIEESGFITITAEPPADTVVDGQALCSVVGAVIRRGSTDYPKTEFEGDYIGTVKERTQFTDPTADINGTYYYSAFPYTTQGVYNRSPQNRFVVNQPAGMVYFKASDNPSGGYNLKYELPPNVIGAVIRRDTVTWPSNENEGVLVTTVTENGTYVDTDVDKTGDIVYFYTAFPYTATGAYNREDPMNKTTTKEMPTYIYGYDLNINDSNPATRVTYPEDVDNHSFTPRTLNNAGDWPLEGGFMPRPCALNLNGTVAFYLNPNDYSLQENGTASGIDNSAAGFNAMMEWPCIYTKRWETEDGIYHFRVSDVKVDPDYDCWCNYNVDDEIVPHFYTSIYKTTSNERSFSGQLIGDTGTGSITKQGYVTACNNSVASKNGSNRYTITLASELFLIQDLLVLMGKSTNTKAVYGNFWQNTNNPSTWPKTGATDKNGLFFGGNGSGHNKIFGMEDFFGSVLPYVAVIGFGFTFNKAVFKITPGTHDGSTSNTWDPSGGVGFKRYNLPGVYNDTNDSYVFFKKYITFSFGRIAMPGSEGGSNTTYECSGVMINRNYLQAGQGNGACLIGGPNARNCEGAFSIHGYPQNYFCYGISYR